MKRIREIIADIRNRYPTDDFFSDFEETYSISASKKKAYQAYGKVLNKLDEQSWKVLKEKALNQFKNHREGQRKQGFFNQLNEAFAYSYLANQRCKNISFLKEDGNMKPDIEYVFKNSKGYCEVKTLSISDLEIDRRGSLSVIDGEVYCSLTDGFLNKFHEAICIAWEQINSLGKDGLVYLIVNFDDIALDHYKNYRQQLIRYCKKNEIRSVFIKIGYLGKKRISITQPFS
ncbi:hypothetical protein CHL67_06760 [Prosthecochloris sp. GSB1]|uniref:hypothetical protein n=1 Tax=Prosthecochloris sp. GSB1 TaxID=281093 RepID=UPI000B8C6F6A|nr:hypothetical protein [Prosthecochloris sp. GSB1]ASQ90667.1 hypothetical protein CHL67_06760 [Prosthecochloris sp. GSB1]